MKSTNSNPNQNKKNLNKINYNQLSYQGKNLLNLNTKKNILSTVNSNQKSEYTSQILLIRQQIKEEIKGAGHKIPEIKTQIINKWITVINILSKKEIRLFLEAYRVLGELFIEFVEYEHAKKVLLFLRLICINLEFPYELSRTYESLGSCYKYLNNYKKSIVCYKKQVEIAWMLNDYVTELRCYDNIGLQYYYLNNKYKAKYYHFRYINGKIEMNTPVRQKTVDRLKHKNIKLFINNNSQIKAENEVVDNNLYKKRLFEVLTWFDIEKIASSIEEIDSVKVSEKLNDSNISDCENSFLILNDDVESDQRSMMNSIGKKRNSLKLSKLKQKTFNDNDNENEKEKDDLPNLSHLSNRRKEYSIERFDKIFEVFDMMTDPLKYNRYIKNERMIKSINRSYIFKSD